MLRQPRIFRSANLLCGCKFGKVKPKQFFFFIFQAVHFHDFTNLVVGHLFKFFLALTVGKPGVKDNPFNLCGDAAKDFFALANAVLENTDTHQTAFINISVYRSFGNDIIDVYGFASLASAINSADTLLDTHWIPGQVVVDHGVAELIVKTF